MRSSRTTRSSADFRRLPLATSEPSPAATLGARKQRAMCCANACGGAMPANAPVANGLIDTGAILALLDRADRWHTVCVDAFRQLRLPLLTSEAVLAEGFHLVGYSRHEMEAAWKFGRSGPVTLGIIEPAELTHLQS